MTTAKQNRQRNTRRETVGKLLDALDRMIVAAREAETARKKLYGRKQPKGSAHA